MNHALRFHHGLAGMGCASVLLISACAARTPLAVGSSDAAASNDAAVADSADDRTDSGSFCSPIPNPGHGACPGKQACQAWAQSLTAAGFAHSDCGTETGCLMGDTCFIDNTGHKACACGAGACSSGEVCVSDTPDGAATCRKMCVDPCTAACASAACLCETPDGIDVCSASGRVCDQSGLNPACVSECAGDQ